MKRLGQRRWKQASGYHREGREENTFFRYKSIIGDGLRAWSPTGQAVVGPCPRRAAEGSSHSVVATVFSYVLNGYVSVKARMTSTGAGKDARFYRRC